MKKSGWIVGLLALTALVACGGPTAGEGMGGAPSQPGAGGTAGEGGTGPGGSDPGGNGGAEPDIQPDGANGDAQAAMGGAISYAAEVEPVIVQKCTMSCHAAGLLGGPGMEASGSGLDLGSGTGYAALMVGASVQVDMPFITPGDRENSYAYLKLAGGFENVAPKADGPLAGGAMPTGLKMPFSPTGGELTDAEVELFGQWIDQGAKP